MDIVHSAVPVVEECDACQKRVECFGGYCARPSTGEIVQVISLCAPCGGRPQHVCECCYMGEHRGEGDRLCTHCGAPYEASLA